jgi:hypothetical protein
MLALAAEPKSRVIEPNLPIDEVVDFVAGYYQADKRTILEGG